MSLSKTFTGTLHLFPPKHGHLNHSEIFIGSTSIQGCLKDLGVTCSREPEGGWLLSPNRQVKISIEVLDQ